jgi:hypothetical protein
MCSNDVPNLSDEFDLLYIRGIHGWSLLHVVTPDTQIAVIITHIFSDPIEELSALCCGLLRGEPRSMVRLHGEPGATLVITAIHPKQKHVARIEFWDCAEWENITPRGTPTLSVDVKIRQFVGLVWSAPLGVDR